MNNSEIIDELKQHGYKVSISHYRFDGDGNEKRYYKKTKNKEFSAQTNGGRTVVELVDKDRVVGRGEAICSLKDNYYYKLGVSIALGRAISNLTQ